MIENKYFAYIRKIAAILICIACFTTLFFTISHVDATENSLHNHYCNDEINFLDNDTTDNIHYECTQSCHKAFCHICIDLSKSCDAVNSNYSINIGIFLSNQLIKDDILGSIFKPPKL